MGKFIALIACLITAWIPGANADWPDFRGPTGQGHTAVVDLPLHWSESENVAWKTAIHDFGHASPVEEGGKIWLTTATKDGTRLYAIGVDASTGAILHDIEVFQVEKPQRIHPVNSYATPSPTIEPGRVYVHYGDLGTACIDTGSGEILWRRDDLRCEHMQGPSSSPILFEDLVIIHLEGVEKPYIVALNKMTGETVWRYTRPADLYTPEIPGVYQKSCQTPLLIEVNGQPQMISNGALMATGHNPRTGDVIWKLRYRDDSAISRVVTGHGLLFVNTGGNPGGSQLYAVREGGTGDITETHVVWKMLEDAPHESSPVVVGDLLYTMSDRGVLKCIEATTGAVVWAEDLREKHSASLLASGNRIHFSNKRGQTTIIEAGRAYKVLATNQLDGELWTSPAVVGHSLVLRTKTHLYRIGAGE